MIVEQVSKDFWRLTVVHGCRQLVFFSTVSGEEVTSKWNRYVRDLDFDKYQVTTSPLWQSLEHYDLKDFNS
jgi:hypothetical protein